MHPWCLPCPGCAGTFNVDLLEVTGRVAPCDGVAEVWYDTVEDFLATADSPEYATLLADEKNFMGAKTQDSVFVIVEEDEFCVG